MAAGWRQALVYTHRWLGIVLGVLFVVWFASGIVMMYARMPELPASEVIRRARPLDLSAVTISLAEAARRPTGSPDRVRVTMLGNRPVYRFPSGRASATVFADTGEIARDLTADEALTLVRGFVPEHAHTIRYDTLLTDADQWTMGVRAAMPLHRVAVYDTDDSYLYVSQRSGEIVMRTTARERRWAYPGAVLHWLYFAPFRRHTEAWTQTIIWLSVAGCVMVIAGLAWGLMMARRSPYSELMKWHHYAGLIFGTATLTFVFSGLLSMGPWDWSPGTAPTREQRDRVAGGALRLDAATPDALRESLLLLNASHSAPGCKEMELQQFAGRLYARCETRAVEVGARHAFDRLPAQKIEDAARAAMPGTPIESLDWLSGYDNYYYARDGRLSLPVLRARYGDPVATWLYFDPRTGRIARKEERRTRVERWLYRGFHSLDFPFLYYRRPLWDVVVIALSIGGLVLSATTLLPGWRRLRRRFTSAR